jgi:hypothetical protein
LLISNLLLFSHQPQAIADLEEPLPVLQPGLVAVNNQIQIWSMSGERTAQPAPVLLPPAAVERTPPTVAAPKSSVAEAPLEKEMPAFEPKFSAAETPPQKKMPALEPTLAPEPLAEARTYWPESATLLAQLSQQSEVSASVRQLLTTNACRGCNLRGVNLQNAMLMNADLTGADLSAANLREADLRGAKLSNAILSGASLSGAIMPDGLLHQ